MLIRGLSVRIVLILSPSPSSSPIRQKSSGGKMVSSISINRPQSNERNSWQISFNLSLNDFCQNTLIHSQSVRQSINLSTNYRGSDIGTRSDLMELISEETRWSNDVLMLQYCSAARSTLTYPLQIFNLQRFISDLSWFIFIQPRAQWYTDYTLHCQMIQLTFLLLL